MSVSGSFSHTCPDQLDFTTEWSNVSQYIDYQSLTNDYLQSLLLEARGMCPVRTGFLLSSISGEATEKTIEARADAYYAVYVEYGTWKMEAQPFFIETFYENADECGKAIFTLLENEIGDAVSRATAQIQMKYSEERWVAYQEFLVDCMTGDFIGASEIYWQKVEELEIIMINCLTEITEKAEDYLAESSYEIFAE